MFLALISFSVVILLVWTLVKWRRVKNYWADRGVPFDPPHPLLGSLTFLQRENPALWMRKMYNKFRAPYIGIWLFWQPGLIINSPELAKRVLVKDSDVFRNRFLGSGKSDPIGALNLVTVNDPIWSNVRRRLTSVFTSAKLRSLEGLMRAKSEDLVQRIREEMKKDPKQFNLRVMYSDFTTDVIGETAFGIKSECTRTGDSVVRKITRDFMEYGAYRGLCWSSIFFFPSLVDTFGFSMFPKKTTAFLRDLFRKMVEQRGGLDAPVSENRDLLDALLKMRQDAAKEGEEVSEDLLLAQAAIFLQAGFDTSGGTLTWLTYELAHQPHLQDRLYEELRAAVEKHGTDQLDSNQLADLTFMNALIKEALRKWAPMGWLDRVAAKDYKIDDSLTIKAGTVLYVNAFGMQWDADYFPEPEVFDPERFMPENEKNIKPYTYMPFGEGPRICIGMRFAYNSVRFGLFSTFLNYSVRTLPGSPVTNECSVERKGMLLMPDTKMSVIFTPRN